MDEETAARARFEHLLEQNLELSKDTNRIVRDLHKWTRIAFWTRVVLWILVIVLPLILLGSLISSFVPSAENGAVPGTSAFGFPSQEQLQEAIDLYLGGGGEQF